MVKPGFLTNNTNIFWLSKLQRINVYYDLRQRHVTLPATERGWGKLQWTSELTLKPLMKSFTPLPCGWQTDLTSFALAFSVFFDIKPGRHDGISKFTNTKISQVSCKNYKERRKGGKSGTMHIVSNKCQPTVSCYALTRKRGWGWLPKCLIKFWLQHFATIIIKLWIISSWEQVLWKIKYFFKWL